MLNFSTGIGMHSRTGVFQSYILILSRRDSELMAESGLGSMNNNTLKPCGQTSTRPELPPPNKDIRNRALCTNQSFACSLGMPRNRSGGSLGDSRDAVDNADTERPACFSRVVFSLCDGTESANEMYFPTWAEIGIGAVFLSDEAFEEAAEEELERP